MYRIEYDRDAIKALAGMSADQRKLIRAKVERLAADPRGRNPQAKPLSGPLAGLFRLRVGDWRVIYHLDHAFTRVSVTDIKPRGGVYE
jgi:mRNA interferase RelE/StbE